MDESSESNPDDVPKSVVWARRAVVAALGGGTAVIFGAERTADHDTPRPPAPPSNSTVTKRTDGAAWSASAGAHDNSLVEQLAPESDVGPERDYRRVVNVKRFDALGDGSNDDSDAIEHAVSFARKKSTKNLRRALYFPAGAYIVSRPLNFSGLQVLGEPPHTGSGSWASVIIASEDFTPEGSEPHALVYADATDPRQPIFLENLTLNANAVASQALSLQHVLGGRIDKVSLLQGKEKGLYAAECDSVAFHRVASSFGRDVGMHFLDCSNVVLTHPSIDSHGVSRPSTVAGKVEGNYNKDAIGLLIEESRVLIRHHRDGSSGPWRGVDVFYGQLEQGSNGSGKDGPDAGKGGGITVLLRNLSVPGGLSGVYIEPALSAESPMVIEGCVAQVIQSCRMTGGRSDDDVIPGIHLRSGAGGRPSSGNLIQQSYIALNGAHDTASPLYGSLNDMIRVDADCPDNRFESNLAGRSTAPGARMTYGGSTNNPETPTVRSHVVGQRQVIHYAPAMPTVGTWMVGDVVFNTEAAVGKPLGWICTAYGPKFLPFGDRPQVVKPPDIPVGH